MIRRLTLLAIRRSGELTSNGLNLFETHRVQLEHRMPHETQLQRHRYDQGRYYKQAAGRDVTPTTRLLGEARIARQCGNHHLQAADFGISSRTICKCAAPPKETFALFMVSYSILYFYIPLQTGWYFQRQDTIRVGTRNRLHD